MEVHGSVEVVGLQPIVIDAALRDICIGESVGLLLRAVGRGNHRAHDLGAGNLVAAGAEDIISLHRCLSLGYPGEGDIILSGDGGGEGRSSTGLTSSSVVTSFTFEFALVPYVL